MKKLTTEILAQYLPYGLNIFDLYDEDKKKLMSLFNGITEEPIGLFNNTFHYRNFHEVKPILRPLSDLTREELEEQGFWHHIDYLTKEKQIPTEAPYHMVRYLLSQHYDIFGLIPNNLAIDINTI